MTSSRDRIVEATLELINHRGLSAVTMVEVARTAGVARATLYNHYPDVPSILVDAVAAHNEQASAGLRQALAVAVSPTGTIEQLVRHIAALSSHGHTLQTPRGLPPELDDQLSVFTDEVEGRLEDALIEGVKAGDFRSTLDPDLTARLLRHMLVGLSELVADTPDDAARVTDETLRTILASITTEADR